MIRKFGRYEGPVHYSYAHQYGDVTDVMRSMRVGATQAGLLIWEWSHRDWGKDIEAWQMLQTDQEEERRVLEYKHKMEQRKLAYEQGR